MSKLAEPSAAPTYIDFRMEARRRAGASVAAIAGELGCSTGAVAGRLEKMQRYRSGEQLLAEDPLSLEGLKLTGAIRWEVASSLKDRGAERLADLCDWSEAELNLPAIGAKAVADIKKLMTQHGLELHPPRSEAKERPSRTYERYQEFLAGRRAATTEIAEPATVTRQVDNVVYVDFRPPA